MSSPTKSLTGTGAVVTGGASGLGRAITEALAMAGASVAVLDADGPAAQAAAAELVDSGCDVLGLQCDVTDPDSLSAAMGVSADRFEGIRVVFANAGISAGPGPGSGGKSLLELDDENWDRVLAVNLSGVIRTARAALPFLIESGSGRLIITSSSAAIMPTLFVGHAYAASKAAVHHLTQYLALELAEHKVLVNCLAPGPFETNIASGRLKQPDIAEQVAKSVPLGRIADPSEIGPVALLLASPDNGFMTGSLISIDGGTVAGNWSH